MFWCPRTWCALPTFTRMSGAAFLRELFKTIEDPVSCQAYSQLLSRASQHTVDGTSRKSKLLQLSKSPPDECTYTRPGFASKIIAQRKMSNQQTSARHAQATQACGSKLPAFNRLFSAGFPTAAQGLFHLTRPNELDLSWLSSPDLFKRPSRSTLPSLQPFFSSGFTPLLRTLGEHHCSSTNFQRIAQTLFELQTLAFLAFAFACHCHVQNRPATFLS